MEERWYACIDLKSYYASVECVDRGLDPLTTNLVVADETRSDKTICLLFRRRSRRSVCPGGPGCSRSGNGSPRSAPAPGRRCT